MPGTDPVAVIGMGAVGTLLAGALAAAGHPILACGRAPLAAITVTTGTANPLTALTGRRAEVLRDPPVAALAMDLLQEAVAIARAEGARLPDKAALHMLAWLQALPVVNGGIRHHIPTPASKAVMALLSALPPASPQGMP